MKFKPYEKYKKVKLPWIDEIPSHWEMNKVKYKFDLVKEPSTDKNPTVLSLTQKGIKIRDIELNEGQLAKSYEGYNTVKKGYICLNPMDLESGAASKSEYNGVISNAYFTIRPKGFDINSDFYSKYFNLHYKKKIFYGFGKGVGRPEGSGGRWTLNRETFTNFPILSPPKEEQDKIADFLDLNLDKIDKFVELTERQIEFLKEQKEVIINDAVTKGIDKNVDYKDSGIDWIGEIPEHWDIERVKNITELASRGVTPIYTEKRLIKVVNQATFSKGYWDISNVRYTEVSPVDCRGVLKPNDILLASTGGGVLGKVYYFTENDIYIADSHVTILRFNEKIISKYMYYHFLVKYDFINACLAQGATNQTEIQGGWLRSFKLPIPPLEEQKQIVAHIEKETSKIDKTIDLYKKQIDLIKEYRTSLISQAVTGKIDVRDFEGGTTEWH